MKRKSFLFSLLLASASIDEKQVDFVWRNPFCIRADAGGTERHKFLYSMSRFRYHICELRKKGAFALKAIPTDCISPNRYQEEKKLVTPDM